MKRHVAYIRAVVTTVSVILVVAIFATVQNYDNVVMAQGARPAANQRTQRPATAQATNSTRAAATQEERATTTSAQSANQEEEQKLSPEEEALYQDALAKFNRQDFNGALETLKTLAKGNPAARPPRLIMARWFSELQNAQAVRVCLEMATEENPDDPEAYFSLAEIALREGALTACELLCERGEIALAKYNANPTRQKNLTHAALTVKLAYSNARQRWTNAQQTIAALIKLDGETPELMRAYARTLFQQNQFDQARNAFLRAEKLPNDQGLPADAAMAQLYAAKGDAENAKRSLDAALAANPKSTPVLLLSISNALNENDLDSAWELVRKLYAEDKSVDVLKTYGKVALFRGDYRSAEAAFQEAVRQKPLDSDATGGLALALCEQNDQEKTKRAVQYAASNLQKQSNNRDFLATLGWTLYKSGQVEEATKVLQQSIADGQINAASAYYFAVILNEKGQTDAARQLLTAALATRPPFAKRAAAQALLQSLAAPTNAAN
ncbi:MAG: tetratricopeptide repeat protein [Planctomycetia bacterium]|nr:tetratricopeptide repeat protein [Planctomycetia bacterium]